jgi:hypothetical protein
MLDEWQPATETRFQLVDQMVVGAWRIQRCVKTEQANTEERIENALYEYDTNLMAVMQEGNRLFDINPAQALKTWLSEHAGVVHYINIMERFLSKVNDYRLWDLESFSHFMKLHGFRANAPANEIGIAGPIAYNLAAHNDPENFTERVVDISTLDLPALHNDICNVVRKKLESLRASLNQFPDPEIFRKRVIDMAMYDSSKEGQNLARHEDRLMRGFRANLKELTSLMKTNLDIVTTDDVAQNEPTPTVPQPPTVQNEPTPAAAAEVEKPQNEPTVAPQTAPIHQFSPIPACHEAAILDVFQPVGTYRDANSISQR